MIYFGDKEIGVVVDSIDLSQTTATADDVLEGKEFFNASGEKVTGTYINKLSKIMDESIIEMNEADLSGATGLRDYAFYSCDKLTHVEIPNTVTSIGSSAFAYCKALPNIHIPDSVNFIGIKAFEFNDNLTSVTFGENIQIDTFANYLFRTCYQLNDILIPKSVTRILPNCFSGCKAFKNIIIPKGVTELGNSAFYNCTNITSITFENDSQLLKIESDAFGNCTALPTITIPRSVKTLSSIFRGDTNLTDVIFEKGSYVTSWSSTPFNGCTNLTNLTLRNLNQSIQIASGTTYGHLLTLESLLNTIQELWTNTTTSTRTLTMGTTNIAKLANVYIKLIPITDEMRAEDEYIDKKAPFVQCESTDEGAMLVTEYVTTVKNWQLA